MRTNPRFTIHSDPKIDYLIITGPPKQLEEAKNIIRTIDRDMGEIRGEYTPIQDGYHHPS